MQAVQNNPQHGQLWNHAVCGMCRCYKSYISMCIVHIYTRLLKWYAQCALFPNKEWIVLEMVALVYSAIWHHLMYVHGHVWMVCTHTGNIFLTPLRIAINSYNVLYEMHNNTKYRIRIVMLEWFYKSRIRAQSGVATLSRNVVMCVALTNRCTPGMTCNAKDRLAIFNLLSSSVFTLKRLKT